MHKIVQTSPCMEMNRRILIDGNNLAWQVFHGVNAALSSKGQRTDITFGFLRRILGFAEKFNTKNFIFCWDSRNSLRKRISPSYKSNRFKTDDPDKIKNRKQVNEQMVFLRSEILPGLGFNNSFEIDGYEADDIMAAVSQMGNGEHFDFIASSDDDMIQCLDYFTCIFNIRKNKIFTYGDFQKKYGEISPWFWAEAKAIGGCNSDRVKGVSGVADPAKSHPSDDIPPAMKYLKGELKKGKIYERIESKGMQRRIAKNRLLVHLPLRSKACDNYLDFYRDNIKLVADSFRPGGFSMVFGRYSFYSFLKQETFERWRAAFCEKPKDLSDQSKREIIKREDTRSKQKTGITGFL